MAYMRNHWKRYDATHREERRVAGRLYREQYPDLYQAAQIKYNTSLKGELSRYMRDIRTWAHEKGVAFHLTKEQVAELQEEACHYCGDEGGCVDCVEIQKGFVVDNIVPCCNFCNQAKKDKHVLDFLRIMCNIASVHDEEASSWVRDYNFVKIPTWKYSESYTKYKYRAEKERHLLFQLTEEQFNEIVSSPCYYCAFRYDDDNHRVGVDRKDSDEGYVMGNVVPCCVHCNFTKRDYSEEIFILKAVMIFKKQMEE